MDPPLITIQFDLFMMSNMCFIDLFMTLSSVHGSDDLLNCAVRIKMSTQIMTKRKKEEEGMYILDGKRIIITVR